MSSNRPGDEAPFTWPPAAADLDRIDILDVTKPADVPVPEAASSPALSPLHQRARSRPRSRTRTRARATGRDGWLLLASGVLIGAMLPGLVQVHTTASTSRQTGPSTPTSPTLRDMESEGAALRAMQALLRGDAAPTARVAVSTPAPVRPPVRIGPAGDVDPLPIPQPTVLPARTDVRAATAPPSRPPAARRASVAAATKARTTNTNARDVPVRRVLQDYERAWTRMDTQAARALWPSVDPDALQAKFRPVSEQRLQLAACDIGMSGDRALAICLGTLRYRPRVGNTVSRIERGRWEFELQRSPVGWHISNVEHP